MDKKTLDELCVNAIRFLSIDTVQKANSGHPGAPMGAATMAYVLWDRFLKHDPGDPQWPDRDRFLLSAGHASTMLYALLYLTGYDLSIDELKSFRQWGSRTAGHPEYGHLPGVETTTGPLGQGFGNGVGMAIASKMMSARFGEELFGGNYIYAIAGDGCLMEGVSSEAASIAGHLKLGNLIYFYDDNTITIEGHTDLTFSEDVEKRFLAYGWHVVHADAYDHDSIRKAIIAGQNEKEKPTLIITKSLIGYGSPNKNNTHEVHGSPLGAEELLATKKNLNWPTDKEFYVPEEVAALFAARKSEMKKKYDEWMMKYGKWKIENDKKAKEYEKYISQWVPENLEEELLNFVPKEPNATRTLSSKVIQKIAQIVPNFVGGSADLAPSTNTYMKEFEAIAPGKFGGKNFHFGIREHAMGAIVNGIILYGGFRAFGATFFVFSDYMRPTIRLAAIMEIPALYVFTHDTIFVGEDGPTHQPVEQLAVLRAIPNTTVFRPADGIETAMAWAFALRHKTGPVALILTRQKIEAFERDNDFNPKDVLKGAYIVSKESGNKLDLVIAASGSEVPVAAEAKKLLSDLSIRVVSIPSREVFEKQPDEYKTKLFPADVPVVVVEAVTMTGWGDLFRQKLLTIGMTRFGASGPYKTLAEKFGFTGKQVAEKIQNWLKK